MPAQMTDMNPRHVFTVHFRIEEAGEDDGQAEGLYEDDRLQDVLLGVPSGGDGLFEADFERIAPHFADAVISALRDLQQVFPEAELLSVAPDDLVTLSGIAERTGRSHESIRLLASGKQGPGGFPREASGVGAKTKVWRWHEVTDWFEREMKAIVPDGENAKFLAMINDILRLRRTAPQVIDNRRTGSEVAGLLPTVLTS